jgi:Tol biopolymer transport system component/imidazolonepropionase-like amidohydrolase
MRRMRWVAGLMLCGLSGLLLAQEARREVRVTLREGTSMAAAPSPDGRVVLVDLLGVLWSLDAAGGEARRLLPDGYDAHAPAWSPDGRRVAFQAYLKDTWHLWVMNADGTGLVEVTAGPFDDREPHWSPDGTRLAFASDRSGQYDIWVLTLATGTLARLTTNPANDSMPSWSPDGREIAFVSDREARGIYARRIDGGVDRLVVADRDVAHSPSWSPDGRSIAHVSVAGAVSRLMVDGRTISDADEDVFPFRPTWDVTGQIWYSANGQVRRRPRAGGAPAVVPFTAQVSFARDGFVPRRTVTQYTRPQPVRGVMQPVIAPDGQRAAFVALGDLWLVSLTERDPVPQRLTNDAAVEMNPAWAPDGQSLVFSSDRDGQMDLWVRDLRTGHDRRLAAAGALPTFSPDGTRVAFLDPDSQLRVVTVASGEARTAHGRLNEPGKPSWSPDGRAVVMSALRTYSTRFREGTNQVLWVQVEPSPSVDGRDAFSPDRWIDPLPHKSIGMRQNLGPVWSPDGREMVAIVDGSVSIFPVGRDGTSLGSVRRVTADLASSPSWAADSRHVLYQTADVLKVVDTVTGEVRTIRPALTVTAPEVTGVTTIHAARLFDARDTTVRTGVDIVIAGARIREVRPHRDDGHEGRVVDAGQGTVLPGLIESHTHLRKDAGEALGRLWLSFGITTVRNPAANAFEALEDREAIESGRRLGPRLLLTGEPIDGTRIYYSGGVALDGGADIDAYVGRAQTLGFDLIKTYVRLPDLLQRRVIAAAHRAGMPVTSHELYPAVAYGADGVEHVRGTSRRGFNPKMSETRRSYRDVVELLTASGMTLTPTIGIQGGHQVLTLRDGSWLEDERLQRLVPDSLAASRALRQAGASAADLAAREALVVPQEQLVRTLVRNGGRVIAGTDSPINPYGISLLLELEHYVRGGLTPAEAIRTATAVPAEALGIGSELGTIEAGKLADLIVVEGNPLDDIRQLRRVRQVMRGGVLHDVRALVAGQR